MAYLSRAGGAKKSLLTNESENFLRHQSSYRPPDEMESPSGPSLNTGAAEDHLFKTQRKKKFGGTGLV